MTGFTRSIQLSSTRSGPLNSHSPQLMLPRPSPSDEGSEQIHHRIPHLLEVAQVTVVVAPVGLPSPGHIFQSALVHFPPVPASLANGLLQQLIYKVQAAKNAACCRASDRTCCIKHLAVIRAAPTALGRTPPDGLGPEGQWQSMLALVTTVVSWSSNPAVPPSLKASHKC